MNKPSTDKAKAAQIATSTVSTKEQIPIDETIVSSTLI